jgi:hypothetical protein
MPVPEPGRLERVHREHPVTGRDQCRDPRAAVSLDPDQHLRIVGVLAQLTADQAVQLRDSSRTLSQPLPGQYLSRLVHHLDVVMVLSPVITHEQPHQHSLSRIRPAQQPAGELSAT